MASLEKFMKKINLSLAPELLNRLELTAKALCISRSDYIRQAISRALKKDEELVIREVAKYHKPKTAEQLSEGEALLKKYGML